MPRLIAQVRAGYHPFGRMDWLPNRVARKEKLRCPAGTMSRFLLQNENRPRGVSAARPFSHQSRIYMATRSFEILVPIALNVVTIWLAEVSRKNLLGSVAQFCSSVEVGSPPVLT